MTCVARAPAPHAALARGRSLAMSSRVASVSRRTVAARAADLDPDNTNILVCGGGGVALETVKLLKDMGSWVWMMQRHDERKSQIEKWFAVWVKGDAMDKASVDKVFQQIEGGQVDAVVCTLGGTLQDYRVDSAGNINVMEAAAKNKVKKFILVTSIGCGESRSAISEQAAKTLGPVLDEKDKAEKRLWELAGDMEVVIVRPGGLKSDEATGKGILTEDQQLVGAITRKDTARMVVKALFSKKTGGKVLHALDRDMTTPADRPVTVFEC